MNHESLIAEVAQAQKHLDALRGGQVKVWHYRYSYSQLVIRITMPSWTSRRAYLDCTACSSVSYLPSWEPVNIAIAVREDHPLAPLLVVDGDRFRVECQTVRVEELDDDNGRRPFPPTAGLASSSELVDRIREGVFLAKPTLSNLRSFLAGYKIALHDLRINKWNEYPLPIREFYEWVKIQLGCEKHTVDGLGAISLKYDDDKEAYRRFFELWQEYRVQKHLPEAATTASPIPDSPSNTAPK